MLKFYKALRNTQKGRDFLKDPSGEVAILFGLMAIALFLTIGGAVDFGRWLHARNQTIVAMDTAVLAAGRALQVGGDTDAAVAAAQAYYTENVVTRLPLLTDTINFVVADDGMSVTATGNATIATPFLSIAHIEELEILDNAGVDYSKSEIAIGGNAGINLEISMMLDVTGSMAGSRLDDLKVAATDLVNIIVWDDQSEYKSRVALVPFSESIRLPSESDFKKIVGKKVPNTKDVDGSTYYKSQCLAERTGNDAFTDAETGPGNYVLGVYVPNNNGNCSPGEANKVVPLTNNKSQLRSNINQMQASGYTAGHIGTAWAWYMLSPNWNKIWPSKKYDAVAYGTPETKKIAILMTDGEYNTQYDKNGIDDWYTSESSPNGSSTTQARALCDSMKASEITIYTVGFGLSEGSSASTTMAQCATDSSKAFTAEDGEQLKQAFRAIALELSKLRLSS